MSHGMSHATGEGGAQDEIEKCVRVLALSNAVSLTEQ